MSNLNKKQKIIVGIIASIVVAGICYYVYAKDTNLLIEEGQNLEMEQNQVDDSKDTDPNQDKESDYDTIIMVHVSGAVNQEGVVELKANARIADAIEKAGGVKESACMDEINLAYVLEDGMKIHIPTRRRTKEFKGKGRELYEPIKYSQYRKYE